MTVEKFKDGTVFGDTKRPKEQIKELYPNAVFVPVCACGYYMQVYKNDFHSKENLVADYLYLKDRDTIPLEARKEKKSFGQYFKIKWHV